MAENEFANTTDENDGVVLGDDVIGELSEQDPAERSVFFAFDEASQKLEEDGGFEPFVALLCGEELQVEELEGDDEDAIYAALKKTIFQMDVVSDAYVFCYDGYVDLDDGPHDAILLEWARNNDEQAQILAWLYQPHNDHIDFIEPLYSLGETDNFFLIGEDTDNAADNAAVDGADDGATAAGVDGDER
ncbi:MAG: hypothetical protein LBH87_01520 [Coriobacteriales bacterium]|nr:hypothetical protein [Coriobacteriales bacterium]